MPRDLTRFDNNELTLQDSVSGSSIVLYHRSPTTDDRVAYQASRFRREGNRLINCSRRAAISAAAGILTGIREGDFTLGRDAAGHPLPLSSDPSSPHYCADWTDHVADMAGDLLYIMGTELFEGRLDPSMLSGLTVVDEGDEPQDETDGGDIPPLAMSSGD